MASKTDKYTADKQAIKEVFNENEQRYGYRRITDALHAKGIIINHKKMLRLMKMLGIHGKMRKNEKYHSYKGEVGKVADNLLNRDFNAENAFEKLATDVTQFKEAGCNLEAVMIWAGHSFDKDVKTSAVDRGYTDYSEEYLYHEAQKIDYEL